MLKVIKGSEERLKEGEEDIDSLLDEESYAVIER